MTPELMKAMERLQICEYRGGRNRQPNADCVQYCSWASVFRSGAAYGAKTERERAQEREPHPSPENVKAWLAALRKQGMPYDMACRLISVMNELLGPCEFAGVLPREESEDGS